jgi:hypothetical protein
MAYITISLEPDEPHIYRLQPIMDYCREVGGDCTYCDIIMGCIELAQKVGYDEVAAIIRDRKELEDRICHLHDDLEGLPEGPALDF